MALIAVRGAVKQLLAVIVILTVIAIATVAVQPINSSNDTMDGALLISMHRLFRERGGMAGKKRKEKQNEGKRTNEGGAHPTGKADKH
jgi:hypothetical protein